MACSDRTHRYALTSSTDGWLLTRDCRPVGSFGSYDQGASVAEKIAADLRRGGVLVDLALPGRPAAGRNV